GRVASFMEPVPTSSPIVSRLPRGTTALHRNPFYQRHSALAPQVRVSARPRRKVPSVLPSGDGSAEGRPSAPHTKADRGGAQPARNSARTHRGSRAFIPPLRAGGPSHLVHRPPRP